MADIQGSEVERWRYPYIRFYSGKAHLYLGYGEPIGVWELDTATVIDVMSRLGLKAERAGENIILFNSSRAELVIKLLNIAGFIQSYGPPEELDITALSRLGRRDIEEFSDMITLEMNRDGRGRLRRRISAAVYIHIYIRGGRVKRGDIKGVLNSS